MTLVGFKARNHPNQTARTDVDDRALPVEDFAPLQRRFQFTIDAAAGEHNTKLPRWFSVAHCGLRNSWAGERVYCNPPYSDIEPWLAKANSELDCPLIVMLLPANRTDLGWWHRHVEAFRDRPGSRLRVEFICSRLRFIAPGRHTVGPNERPPFGSCLLIWSDEPIPALEKLALWESGL